METTRNVRGQTECPENAPASNAFPASGGESSYFNSAFLRVVTVCTFISLAALSTDAHVKWFFDYDVTKPPTPIGEVLDGTFIKLFLLSALACYVFFLVDRYIFEDGIFEDFDRNLKRLDNAARSS